MGLVISDNIQKSASRVSLMILIALAMCCVLYSCIIISAWNSNLLANDVTQYLSMAGNLIDGHGIATSIVYYDENFHIGKMPAAQTVFPPGYPFIIAALSKCGLPLNLSALIICLVGFNISTILTIVSVRKVGHPWGIALLGGVLIGGSISAGFLTLFSMSDIPFTFVTVISFVFIQRLQKGSMWNAFFAGAAAAAAFSIRYAGVFLIVSIGIVFIGKIILFRTRRVFFEALSVLSLPMLTLSALFMRNFLTVGDFKGGNANPLTKSIGEVAQLFIFSFKELIGYAESSQIVNNLRDITLFAIVILIIALFSFARPSIDRQKLKWLACDTLHVLAVVYIVVSLICLYYLEYTRILGVSPRMILPIFYPTILVFCGLLATVRWREYYIQSNILSALIAILYIVGQAGMIDTISKRIDYHETYIRSVRNALNESETIQQLLAGDKVKNWPILANESQAVGGITQQPVIGLTPPDYTSKKWTVDAAEMVIRSFGVHHVLFLPRMFADKNNKETGNQEFFYALANNQLPYWLAPVYTSEDLIVFEVKW